VLFCNARRWEKNSGFMKKRTESPVSKEVTGLPDMSRALLDSARAIFISEGVRGLSVRRLADAAGCTTMAVYSRFKGKDGILGALFDEGFEKLAEAQQAIDPKLINEERLLAFCRAYRAVAHAYPHHYALMLGHFSGELSPSQLSQEKALATLERLTDAVVAMPSMRGKRRTVGAQIATRLFAFCHGWVSLELTGFFAGMKDLDKQFDTAVMALMS
jgi:AcrR family transcriptional regulator